MTEQHGLMVLIGLIGLTWVIGGCLQWLTLRRQEGLIRCLELHREALHRLTQAEKADPWLDHPGQHERGRDADLRSLGLVRSSSWK